MSSTAPTASSGCVPRLVDEECAVIGVDLGVRRLAVAAPVTAGPEVASALVVPGGVERDLFDGLGDTLRRLDGQAGDTTAAEQQAVESAHALLRQRFGLAARALVEYVDRIGADVVALEDIEFSGRTLSASARGRTEAGEWVLPALRDYVEATLEVEGVRVERVDASHTTQECHRCGQLADVRPATISCEVEICPVDTVCRDRSAAVSIARRVSSD